MTTIKSAISILLLLFAGVGSARAVIGEQLWVQRYNGPGNGTDNAFAIAVDASGNVFVAGQCLGSGGNNDFVAIKYSNGGTLLWTNNYNGPGNGADTASDLAIDGSGDVIVAGASIGADAKNDFATIKYSNAGVPLWTNRYDIEGDNSLATAVAVDTNGNVFTTGYSYNNGLATIKCSSTGVALWTNRYLGPAGGYHYAGDIVVAGSGDVFMLGTSVGVGSAEDIVTVKYSNAGMPLWTNRYNGTGNGSDSGNSIAVDGNGDVYVAGGMAGTNGGTEFVTIKYSNTGVPLWTNYYKATGSSPYGGISDIVLDRSNNVFVTGTSIGSGTYNDFATLKYTSAGTAVWTQRHHRLYGEVAIAAAADRSGNLFVAGYQDADDLSFDRLTIAYTPTGTRWWTNTYNGPGNDDDSGNAVAVDADGNVFVTGYSRGATNHDIATIKYAGVQPVPLWIQTSGSAVQLSWSNQTFRLQSAPAPTGTYTNVTGATSPYTNNPTGLQKYFRLRLN